jgi:hypothetical protein
MSFPQGYVRGMEMLRIRRSQSMNSGAFCRLLKL